MRKVRINGTPPDDWIEEAQALKQQLLDAADENERKQIIDDNKKFWRDTRVHHWLLSQFNNKCWYSEAADSVSPDHVDHFRPKGRIRDADTKETKEGYWWLAFDWRNYVISGHLINTKKGDLFPLVHGNRCDCDDEAKLQLECPVLIDPRKDEARLISFEADEDACIALPASGVSDEEWSRAKNTIDILGLNRLDRLNQKRLGTWKSALSKISDFSSAHQTQGAQALALLQQTKAISELKKMMAYEAEFSSIAEAYIRKNGSEPLVASLSESP